jgi:L-arabinose isomerase
MVHTELLMIDSDSTPAAFSDRIAWNQAYYRLAEGLPGRR